MKTLRIFAVMLGLMTIAVAIDASPASAATCYWITTGQSSNCDGKYAPGVGCDSGTITARSVLMQDPGGFNDKDNPAVELRYNPTCRTAWGRIIRGWGRNANISWCTVTVQRNSDQEYYSQDIGSGSTSAYTKMVYDAGTTSYAKAECSLNNGQSVYYGTTGSY
jgi:hypothetical protein